MGPRDLFGISIFKGISGPPRNKNWEAQVETGRPPGDSVHGDSERARGDFYLTQMRRCLCMDSGGIMERSRGLGRKKNGKKHEPKTPVFCLGNWLVMPGPKASMKDGETGSPLLMASHPRIRLVHPIFPVLTGPAPRLHPFYIISGHLGAFNTSAALLIPHGRVCGELFQGRVAMCYRL